MTPHSPDAQERAWERCPSCDGSGLRLGPYTGEPTECWECKGDGWVRARDAKGRFVGKEPRQ